MKHSIIKDFRSWNTEIFESSIFETAPVKPTDPTKDPSPTTEFPAQILGKDGALANYDVQAIQRVLIKGGLLAPTQASGAPSDDGKLGPMTKAAIEEFRKKTNTSDTTPITQTAIGQPTIDAMNKKIQDNVSNSNALFPMSYGSAEYAGSSFKLTGENNDAPVLRACAALIKLFDYQNSYAGGVQVPEGYGSNLPDTAKAAAPKPGTVTDAFQFFKPWASPTDDDENAAITGGLQHWWDKVFTPMLQQIPAGNPNIAIFDEALAKNLSPTDWDKWLPKVIYQMPRDGQYAGVPKEMTGPPAGSLPWEGMNGAVFVNDGYADVKSALFAKFAGTTANDTLQWNVILSNTTPDAANGRFWQFSVDTDFEDNAQIPAKPEVSQDLMTQLNLAFATLGAPGSPAPAPLAAKPATPIANPTVATGGPV